MAFAAASAAESLYGSLTQALQTGTSMSDIVELTHFLILFIFPSLLFPLSPSFFLQIHHNEVEFMAVPGTDLECTM